MLKVISTGFEGAERAALDAARDLGNAWGGEAPFGRSGQFGPIPDLYFTTNGKDGLVESRSSRPSSSRFANAREAGGTLILSKDNSSIPMVCKNVIIFLRKNEGDYFIADPTKSFYVPRVVKWIADCKLRILNVSSRPESMDDLFTKRSFVFMRDIISYTGLYDSTGAKIWK